MTDRLWSPWRMAYIESSHGPDQGCFFCHGLQAGDDEASLILARAPEAFVVMNAYPYNPGHLLVAPIRHVGDLEALSESELRDVNALLQRAVGAVKAAMGPDGFNVGINLGRVAGAGVPGHVHWHVVPRWNGDTNFMPVTGETRVLPELVPETYRRLKPRF